MPDLQTQDACVYYEVWGDATAPTRWYTIFNGRGLDVASMRRLWRLDLGVGSAVLVFDARGTGRTRASAPPTIARLREDVINLWNHLGIDRSIGVSICLGCNLALALAVAVPARVERLHLISASPGPRWYAADFIDWRDDEEHTRRRSERLLMPGYAAKYPLVFKAFADAIWDKIRHTSFLGDTNRFRQAMHDVSLDELLERVYVPCFLLHGQSDEMVSPEASAYLARRLGGAMLHLVPRAGHALFGTGDDNNEILRRFIDNTRPAVGSVVERSVGEPEARITGREHGAEGAGL